MWMEGFNVRKRFWGVVTAVVTVTAGLAFVVNPAHADPTSDSTSTDLNVNIAEVISLSITSCGTASPNEANLPISGMNSDGTFTSCHIVANVGTNNPGYKLSIQSIDSATYGNPTQTNNYFDGTANNTTNLVRVTNDVSVPPTLDTANTIAPWTDTVAAPTVMNSSTTSNWGFAVPKDQANATITTFDNASAYADIASSATTATGKYATVPTTATQLKATTTNAASDATNIYFGTRVKANQAAGTYKGTVVLSAVGEPVPQPIYTPCVNGPQSKGQLGNISTYNFSSWTVGDTGIATDTRNNQQYCVGKLADGHVWMLNNLKLSPNTTLTNADTDLNTISTFNFGGHVSLINDSSTYDYDTPYVYGPLDATNSGNGENYDVSDPTSDHFGGYLYNWSAATAGETTSSITTGDAPNSICPKNWRLPKGGDYGAFDPNNEFDQLNAKMAGYPNNQDSTYQSFQSSSYNDPQFFDNWQFNGAFRGVFAGGWYFSFYDQGDYGGFWSSSAYPGDPGDAFYAFFGSSLVYPDHGGVRGSGLSLRCLLN